MCLTPLMWCHSSVRDLLRQPTGRSLLLILFAFSSTCIRAFFPGVCPCATVRTADRNRRCTKLFLWRWLFGTSRVETRLLRRHWMAELGVNVHRFLGAAPFKLFCFCLCGSSSMLIRFAVLTSPPSPFHACCVSTSWVSYPPHSLLCAPPFSHLTGASLTRLLRAEVLVDSYKPPSPSAFPRSPSQAHLTRETPLPQDVPLPLPFSAPLLPTTPGVTFARLCMCVRVCVCVRLPSSRLHC